MSQSSPASAVDHAAPLITARDLFCERDDRVLFQQLNFSLRRGQVLQVKGSNGSGKTTLLRIVCGLNPDYRGELLFRGLPLVEQRDSLHSSLLYIGHRVGVNKVLTPLENLRWSCGLQAAVADAQLRAALAGVGLRGFEDSQCHALSAGQHQRVALARLLVSTTPLWILDEPFTTLDVFGVALLEKLLYQHAERGGAVMVTTHHELQVPGLEVLTLG